MVVVWSWAHNIDWWWVAWDDANPLARCSHLHAVAGVGMYFFSGDLAEWCDWFSCEMCKFFGMSVKWKNTGILEYPNYLHITDIGYCLGYPFYWHSNIGIPKTLEYSKHRGVMSPRHYTPWRLACQEWGAGQNGRSQDFFGPSLCGEGHHFNTS